MPSIFIEAGNGQGALRNSLFGSRIVARVRDDMGGWMPGEAVQFDLPPTLAQPTGTFPGGVFDFVAVTDANGQARSEFIQADDLLGTWAGTISVVSNPSVKAWFYLRNEVTPFAATSVSITAGGTQRVAKNQAYAAVTARLLDESGVGVAGATLTMTVPAGHGSFSPSGNTRSATTNSTGHATFPVFTANSTLGSFAPQVTFPALPAANLNWKTIDPLIATSISVYAGNNQHTPANFLFAAPLVARVANEANGPVAGIGVTFDAPNSGASLVWTAPVTDPVTRTSDVNGLATSPSFSANSIEGTYNVQAAVSGIFPRTFQLTNGGAAPVPDSFALLISEA